MLAEEDIYQETLDEVCKQKISAFLTKSRMDVIRALAGNKKLNHGELALAIRTSVASLSNRLVKFDEFEYKLLDSESEGKFRYYYLTELCKKYLESCNRDQATQESAKILQHEVLQLKQRLKDLLEEFKNLYEDDWEIELDDALIARIECREIENSEGERLVDDFIIGIEKLLLYDYDNYSIIVLQMLQNSILRARVARFMAPAISAERIMILVPVTRESTNAAMPLNIGNVNNLYFLESPVQFCSSSVMPPSGLRTAIAYIVFPLIITPSITA